MARAESVATAAVLFESRTPSGKGEGISGKLKPCGRRYYVLPVLDSVPGAIPPEIGLQYQPRWAVPFCDSSGTAALTVEVADGRSRLIVSGSKFEGSFISEGEYALTPNGENYDASLPLSPEHAATFAANETGAKVAAIPVAVMTHAGGLGNVMLAKCMRWRIKLDRPVKLAGEYGQYETDEVYVRLQNYCFGNPVLQVADRQQPDTGWIEHPQKGTDYRNPVLVKTTVRYARPVQFDIVHRIR